MPFIESSVFEKQEKIEAIKKNITKRHEQQYVNDQVNPKPVQEKGQKKIVIKELIRHHKVEKEPKITMQDIKRDLEVRKLIENEKQNEISNILSSGEIGEVKKEAINVLAMPHFHPIKRQIFAQKLQKSEIVNNYVDNNIIFRLFNRANENIKFGVIYGMSYLSTNSDYDRLVQIHLSEQKQRQKEVPKEVPKEEKEEKKEKEEEPEEKEEKNE